MSLGRAEAAWLLTFVGGFFGGTVFQAYSPWAVHGPRLPAFASIQQHVTSPLQLEPAFPRGAAPAQCDPCPAPKACPAPPPCEPCPAPRACPAQAPAAPCGAWTELVKYFRWRFPTSFFTEAVPTDLNSFWDFAHQVFFAEGWSNMPGQHTVYSPTARRVLPAPHEGEAVRRGAKRPGTLNGFYMGQCIQKYPMDMWLYQEIFYDNKPDIIVECGTFNGAAAAWYSQVMQRFKPSTQIISIDIIGGQGDPIFFREQNFPNVRYLRLPAGDIDPEAIRVVKEAAQGGKSVMVFLDSNHAEDHVYKQLEIYSDLVTVGQYMIVEDTNIDMNPICQVGNGHRCGGGFRGPYEAVKRWLPTQDRFESDLFWGQVYHISQNPNSWLRRIK